MLTENIILTPVSLDGFLDQIRAVVKEEITADRQARLSEKIIGRIEAAKLLGVSAITVDNYIKGGKLPAKKVSGKVLLNYSDVLAAMRTKKHFK